MRLLILALVTSWGTMAALHPAQARGAGAAAELEQARANARAGGPLNDRDAELLERWGCLSGTDSSFCRKLSHRDDASSQRRRRRKSRD